MREFAGKNAIITGANRGIGNAIVRKFAEAGCDIWACARKKTDDFETEMDELSKFFNVCITPLYFDLASEQEIKENFQKIYKTKKPIDILVNSAGVVNAEVFQRTSLNTMRNVFEANFFGPVQLIQFALKVMTRYKKGCIVNISSIAGIDTNPTNCTYGSSKAALNSFTKILASEVAMQGIRVNAVAPGPTETEMIQIVKKKVGSSLLDRCAMERLANPKEIAETVLFLASDRASFVNGQVIRVDGGAR